MQILMVAGDSLSMDGLLSFIIHGSRNIDSTGASYTAINKFSSVPVRRHVTHYFLGADPTLAHRRHNVIPNVDKQSTTVRESFSSKETCTSQLHNYIVNALL